MILSRNVVPKGDTNSMRWQGQRGHYEAWYLTLNARPEQLGLWLRYTLDAPLEGPPFRELWAHVFDTRAPEKSFGLRERSPIGAFAPPEHALVAVGGSRLEEGRAQGRIAAGGHAIEWELAYDRDPCSVHLAPYALRRLGLAQTEVVFANPDARFVGTVKVDGRELRIDHEPGSQTHLWGRKHAERWTWGHCNAFDGRADCSLDGVAAFLKRGGKERGPVTGVYVRYRGEDYCLNALPALLFARSEVAFPRWRFEGCARDLRFVGTFEARPERMLEVTYVDPDGERSYCANTEVADLTLEVFRGRRILDRLVATGTAHLEFGSRARRPEVRASV